MELTTAFQVALAAMMAEAQEKLKGSNHPALAWISESSVTVNRGVAILLAVLTTIGLQTTWYVDPTSGYATFTLSGIPTSLSTWSSLLVQAFTQFWLQKGWYKLTIRPTMGIDLPPDHQVDAARDRGVHLQGGGARG